MLNITFKPAYLNSLMTAGADLELAYNELAPHASDRMAAALELVKHAKETQRHLKFTAMSAGTPGIKEQLAEAGGVGHVTFALGPIIGPSRARRSPRSKPRRPSTRRRVAKDWQRRAGARASTAPQAASKLRCAPGRGQSRLFRGKRLAGRAIHDIEACTGPGGAVVAGPVRPGIGGSTYVDIFTVAGVPGTGGYSTIVGPVLLRRDRRLRPVMPLDPGTDDFGAVRESGAVSDGTPDAGPTSRTCTCSSVRWKRPAPTPSTFLRHRPSPSPPSSGATRTMPPAMRASRTPTRISISVLAVPSGRTRPDRACRQLQVHLAGARAVRVRHVRRRLGAAWRIARRRARRAGPQAISTRLRPQPLAA